MKGLWRLCVAILAAVAVQPAAAQAEPDFAALMKPYEEFGLPMPPENSELVMLPGPNSATDKSDNELVFVISNGDFRTRGKLLSGIWTLERELRFPPPPVGPGNLKPDQFTSRPDIALEQGIQLWRRGEETIAHAVWKGLQAEIERRRARGQPDFPEVDAAALLAREAWNFWLFALTDPALERTEIIRRLKIVAANRKDLKPEALQRVIADVEASVPFTGAAAGSDEALIDGLLNLSIPRGEDAPLNRVLDRGLEIVPTLVAHSADRRFTRTADGLKVGSTSVRRVGDLVGRILGSWSAGELQPTVDPQEGTEFVPADAAKKWAETVLALKEGDVLTRAALAESRLPASIALSTLRRRAPERLPALASDIFKAQGTAGGLNLLKELAAARLPAGQRSAALHEMQSAGDPAWRFLVIETLFDVDRAAGEADFTQALEEFAEADGKGLTRDEFGRIATLFFRCESKEAHRAFDVLMLHLSAQQRYDALDGRAVWIAERGRRLKFAAEALTYIDNPDFYILRNSSIEESDGMPILRKQVAYVVACALHLRLEDNRAWTTDDWESYLDRMRKALAEATK